MSGARKVYEIKNPGTVEGLIDPDTRALLETRGIVLDPAHPPKPYEMAELQAELVEAGRDVYRLPFALVFPTYDDAEEICKKSEMAAVGTAGILSAGVTSGPLFDLYPNLMFSRDGPEHQRLRERVSAWFSPKAVESCRGAIREHALELFTPLEARGGGELVAEFADPLALAGACIRLGLDPGVVPRIRSWTQPLFEGFLPMSPEQVARAEEAATRLGEVVDEALEERRRAPRQDMLSHLLDEERSDQLSAKELRALVMNLLFGGHDLTRAAISNAAFTLLRFHDSWERLVADKSLIPTAAEECLRFQPPGGAVVRLARSDTTVRGCPVGAGTIVVAGGAAANRDRHHVEDPHRFDVARTRSKIFTFGAGPHYCLGANLARVMLQVALETLAERAPGLRLGCVLEEVEWDLGSGIPFVKRLPIRVKS
jgi:cytochrome P450